MSSMFELSNAKNLDVLENTPTTQFLVPQGFTTGDHYTTISDHQS
jgi:hypothetical protein